MRNLLRPLLILLLLLLLSACAASLPTSAAPTVVTPTNGLPPPVQITQGPSFGQTPTAIPPLAPLRVLSVSVTVRPDNISQVVCGTTLTFEYSATFVLTGGKAGTITFFYTTDGGHSSSKPIHMNTDSGQVRITFLYALTLTLPADHTMPRFSEVVVSTPNAVNSNQASVAGSCVVA